MTHSKLFFFYMMTGIVLRLSIPEGSIVYDCLYYLGCKACLDLFVHGVERLEELV